MRSIKDNCGWELKVAPEVRMVNPPEAKELALLRMLNYKPEPWSEDGLSTE